MSNPSVSMPDKLVDELDERRHANTSRSTVLSEAALVRLHLEDRGEWDSAIQEAEEEIGTAYGLGDASGEVNPR
jgi:metal-responsive CopG/Arc/MetJ family transcriptional regulator